MDTPTNLARGRKLCTIGCRGSCAAPGSIQLIRTGGTGTPVLDRQAIRSPGSSLHPLRRETGRSLICRCRFGAPHTYTSRRSLRGMCTTRTRTRPRCASRIAITRRMGIVTTAAPDLSTAFVPLVTTASIVASDWYSRQALRRRLHGVALRCFLRRVRVLHIRRRRRLLLRTLRVLHLRQLLPPRPRRRLGAPIRACAQGSGSPSPSAPSISWSGQRTIKCTRTTPCRCARSR